ncbi:hypothetical protein TIFTF001_016733 [Ficus carica]|uniref:Uncharacterized protein n=1 Tax=Ficus carica TaxID=3494 RepID=A0AA88A0X5_FICCA|nr:hypothetical protein TIFTF001_016733 [Ficus carica]
MVDPEDDEEGLVVGICPVCGVKHNCHAEQCIVPSLSHRLPRTSCAVLVTDPVSIEELVIPYGQGCEVPKRSFGVCIDGIDVFAAFCSDLVIQILWEERQPRSTPVQLCNVVQNVTGLDSYPPHEGSLSHDGVWNLSAGPEELNL